MVAYERGDGASFCCSAVAGEIDDQMKVERSREYIVDMKQFKFVLSNPFFTRQLQPPNLYTVFCSATSCIVEPSVPAGIAPVALT